ncbi:MAG: gliding motility-associated C-terminal domain-containing protein [Cyclobacteriaceae bacterium]
MEGKKGFWSLNLLLLLLFFAQVSLGQSVEVCNDGIDNDGNGLVDCNDPFCNFPASEEKGCNCFDAADNDGDGLVDSADPNCATYYGLAFVGESSNCSITPPPGQSPFAGIGAPAVSGQNTADTQSKVSVGDVDGDGIPDAVITSKWNSTIRVVATSDGQPDGSDAGDIKADFKTTGQGAKIFNGSGGCNPKNLLFEHENLIADIDKDGKAEIFGIVSNRGGNPSTPPTCFYLVAFQYQFGGLVPLYDAVVIGPDRPGVPGIADMDGDGKAEIYLRDRIYAAETGKLLATSNGNWDLDITSGPVAVNISGSSVMELVCGTKIFSIPSLTNRSPAAPAALTMIHDMNAISANKCFVKLANDPVEYGIDTHSMCSVADIDRDGNIDVVISGALNSNLGATAVFYWNVTNGTVSHFLPPDPLYPGTGWPWGTGRVNLGDANGDGKTDLTFMAGARLWCMTTDAGGNIVPLWAGPRTVNDSRSGVLTATIYDFDNDGKPEMVYRDSQELVVVDGATGTNKLWSATCQSHTYTEGPIIADVNGDGATDICVPCNRNNSFDINDPIQQQALGEVRLFFTNGGQWLPTRKVWNQPGYFVVNIKDDLTLPFPQLQQNLIFSTAPCPNGTPGPQMPMNVFLNQVPFLNANGCPVFPAPDLAFFGDDPANPGVDSDGDGTYTPAVVITPPICGDLGISAFFNIVNSGDLPITDNVPVAFFNGDPNAGGTLLHTTTLVVNNLQVGATLVTPSTAFNGPGIVFDLYIVLYSDGTLPLVIDSPNECSIANNTYIINIAPDPFTTTIEKVSENFKCINSAPDNGELRAHVFKGGVETFDYSPFAFQWYAGPDTSTPIAAPQGTSPNLTGIPEGTYTLVITNTEKGCASDPISEVVIRTGNDPDVTINVLSDQTQCSPANGQLEAVIAGGNTGFSFEWYDISLNPLGITGPIANNLSAGNYVVLVTKDGCTKASDPATVNGPQIPDVQAQVLQHVVDCNNPNSGSVSADALINSVIQDPAGFTFDWYFYDNATSTRGSILPPVHGTGQTRTGLPVGFYQVEIEQISTQCVSGVSPIVEVLDQTVTPAAVITEIAPQTSCDPAQPNGILMAEPQIGGVPQNPADFTFEWFEGDNTLPANAHTSVSGTNGQTANNVKGGGLFYTVRVTSALNCSSTSKLIISENINVPVVTLTPTPNTICDPVFAGTNFNGQMSASVTFAGNPVSDFTNYKFTWHQGSLVTDPTIPVADDKDPLLPQLDGGYYTVVVERTDLFCTGVPVTEEVVNNQVLPAILTNLIASTHCAGGAPNGVLDGAVDVGGTPTTTGFTFNWHQGNSTTDPLVGSAAIVNGQQGGQNFTVEAINNSTGCRNTLTQLLPDNSALPVLTLTPSPNTICDPLIGFNGSIASSFVDANGLGGHSYNYIWSTGSDMTSPIAGQNGPALGGRNGGFYTATITNSNLNCTSDPVTVEVVNNQIFPVIQTTLTPSTNCPGGAPNGVLAAVVDEGGSPTTTGYSFEWFDGNTTADPSVGTTATVNGQQGGTNYTVEVYNDNTGCTSVTSVTLVDNSQLPSISLTPSDNTVCDPLIGFDGSIASSFVDANGLGTHSYTYTWSTGTDMTSPIAGQTGPGLSGRNGGFYTATITNSTLNCTSDPVTTEIINNQVLPVIITTFTPSTNCAGGTPNGVLDAVVDLGGPTTTIGYTFRWFNGNSITDPQVGSTANVGGQQGGSNFTVEVYTNATGCTNTSTGILADNQALPVLTLTPQDNTICVPAPNYDGQITSSFTDANGLGGHTYSYAWSTGTDMTSPIAGQTSSSLLNRQAGFYTATIINNTLNCTSPPVVTEIKDNLFIPVINIIETNQTSCDALNPNGVLSASIDETAIGGGPGTLAGYNFTWTDDATSTVIPNVSGSINQLEGDKFYTVDVTRASTGCTNTETIFLDEVLTIPVVAVVVASNVTRCDVPNGRLNASVGGGVAGFTFYWYNGNDAVDAPFVIANNDFNANGNGNYLNLIPGDYTVVAVNNTTSCVSEQVITPVALTVAPIAININITSFPNTCGDANGAFNSTADNGGGPTTLGFTFDWFDGAPTNSGPIDYFTNPPTFNPAAPFVTSPTPNALTEGVYTLEVTDQSNGCKNFRSITLPFINSHTNLITTVNSTICPYNTGNGEVSLQIVSPGTAPPGTDQTDYIVRLFQNGVQIGADLIPVDPVNPFLVNNTLPPGSYELEVEEQYTGSFCSVTEGFIIDANALPPVVTLVGSVVSNTACNMASFDGQITLNVDKDPDDLTVPTFDIDMNPDPNAGFPLLAQPSGNYIAGSLGPNTYTFTVTASTGCTTVKSFTVLDTPVVSELVDGNVTIRDAEFCTPALETSASVEITTIQLTSGPADLLDDYQFDWYTDISLNPGTRVLQAIGDGTAAKGGEILSNVGAPLPTSPTTFGNYWVVATKVANAGGTGGVGCFSAPLKAIVLDHTVKPTVTLTPFGNTSCDGNFEGQIQIDAVTPVVFGPPDVSPGNGGTYTYNWTSSVAPPPNTAGESGVANLTPNNLQDGTFTVTVINEVTGCQQIANTTISKITPPIFTMTASTIPQQLCTPDGTITVTDTFLNGASEGGTGNFDFTWFRNDPNTAPLVDGGAVQIIVDQITSANYPTIGQGTYYVVATRRPNTDPGSGCSSAPLRIELDDTSVDPVVALTPFSNTACDVNFEGRMQTSATTQAGTPGEFADYTYTWVVTSTTTPPSPPNAVGNELYTLLEDGTYTLTATNNITGCFAAATGTILRSQVPVVIVSATPTPQALCSPDGAIQVDDVTVNNISDLPNLATNFTYSWFLGSLGTPIPTATTPNLNIGNHASIGAGTYLVRARRNPNTSPGSGCESAPLQVKIEDVSVDPTIGITTVSSTACDNNFDGQITVTANTASGPGVGSNYDFTWTAVPAGSSVANVVNAASPFVTAAPDVVGPGLYNVTVRNVTTQCITNGVVTLQSKPQPVDILTVNKTDQAICFPDGSISVTSLNSGVVGNYTFEWHRGSVTSPALVDGTSTLITAPTLNTGNFATIGADTYFVIGRKNAGAAPGSGCVTPPFRVEVLDTHEDPRSSFTFQPNSSCDNLNPNGVVVADAFEQDGTNTDNYGFAWTLNGGALPGVTTISATNNSNQLDNAFEGNYVLVVTNGATGCSFTSNLAVNLDLTISLPNIIDIVTTDPLDCLASGTGEVTSISIGGGPPITGAVLGTDFSYEWFADDFTPANILPTTTPLITSLTPRKYFVTVTDLSTLCKSGPTEMEIDDEQIIYPVVNIAQTVPQISCMAATGTAALAATGDGQTDANPAYQFTWYNTLDLTGPTFGTTSTISNLLAGDYSVDVLNTTTGCTASSLFIVPNEAPQFTPVISLGGQPRTLCVGQDGSMLARVIDISPAYPFPYDFTSALYFGATPNLANPPDVPNMGLVPGFTVNFVENGLSEGFYTVRITDNNTGCTAVLTEEVRDERTPPVIAVVENNPMTNCDPLRANGQLAATADNNKISGYTFDWFSGTAVPATPPAPIVSNNVLIGQVAGDYVVRVTNNFTGCFADGGGVITDATVTPPTPTGIVVFDRTNCIAPNGWVTANVGGTTFNYTFDWYDGNAVAGGIDFTGVDYRDRDIGQYAVTATDDITGCVSQPAVVEVKDARLIPEFRIDTTPSYCSDVGKPTGIGSVILTLTVADVVLQQVDWYDMATNAPVGTGDALYDLFPGFYRAEVVSTEGCTNQGEAEVPTEIGPYNGMSVNGDAQNDVFIIDCISNFPSNNVKIFNRSGILVYEIDGYDNADRSFKGVGEKGLYLQGIDLPVGTYFYIIDKRDGSKPLAGYLELDR